MSFGEMQFDFTPLGRNAMSQHRAAVTGMTMTVYDNRFSVTADVLDALGDPEGVQYAWNDQLDAVLIYGDADGMAAVKKCQGGNTYYKNTAVKEVLQERANCDFRQNFYRLTDGRRYGKFILFRIDDIAAIKREARDGKH